MDVAFLITSAYQLHHYGEIARDLEPGGAIIEIRNDDFGLSEELVERHLPDWNIEWIPQTRLGVLDGKYRAIVCQTPILPMRFLQDTHVVAQQYSLGKEIYQYGVWRSHASLNLMYGCYSTEFVDPFSRATPAGNPLFDILGPTLPDRPAEQRRDRPIVYLPTYGDLSSFRQMAEALGRTDVEVMFKPHHADVDAFSEDLPDNFTFVDVTTHPVELIRNAQAVISDFSGSAYDAAYCRVPVLLAGPGDPEADDFKRLSETDMQHGHLDGLALQWDHTTVDLSTALDRAHELTGDDERYHAFVDRFFVNPGRAGPACAALITDLIEQGPRPHVVADMVSKSLQQHIRQNRRLRSQGRTLRSQNRNLKTGRWRRLAVHDVRELTRRYPVVRPAVGAAVRVRNGARSVVRRARSARFDDSASAERDPWETFDGPPRPDRIRVYTAGLLAGHLQRHGVKFRVDPRLPQAVAVESDDRRELFDALTASDAPAVLERFIARGARTVRRPLDQLTYDDVFGAKRLDLGCPYVELDYSITSAGYAQILFVEWDEDKARMLAMYPRAPIVDWTERFRSDDATATSPVEPDAARHRQGVVAFTEPIDVVYTWVDSSDPSWRASFNSHVEPHEQRLKSSQNEDRFASRDELRYSMRSLELYAPFVRNVYLVTDDQTPDWLDTSHPNLTIVDHREIFPDPSVLPVFNSHAIEACLHRIPGLAEHFVYMNDDTLFGAEVTPDDFFTAGGLAKIRLSPTQYVYDSEPAPTAIPTDFASHNVRRLLERDHPISVTRRVKHVPHPQRRSALEALEAQYPDEFARTRAARFRSKTDLAVPSMMSPWYMIAIGKGAEWPNRAKEYYYADTGRADWASKVAGIRRDRPMFICLNVTLHEHIDPETQAANLFEFLSHFLPIASTFERDRP